jgi:Ca2+-binding RTX toxin-like protein
MEELTKLADMRAEWISANSYAVRRTNLQTGVGASNASLKAMINVLNDAGEDDVLTGGTDADWFFAAIDDLVTDLSVGELVDLL